MTKVSGFTLVEVLVALAAGSVLLAAVASIFVLQQQCFEAHEQKVELVQTARAAMDMIVREVRMAGFDPTGAGIEGISSTGSQLRIATDFRGAKRTEPPDGKTDDPNECILYVHDRKKALVCRNTGGGNQPFAEKIEAFTFTCLDDKGNPTTIAKHIRQVRVTIIARTDPEPRADKKDRRGYQLTSLITPINLACP
jgi:type IV pilus assembly protein PilW